MAEGDGLIYNNFKEVIMHGVFNLANAADELHITLHTSYVPNIDAAHSVWADAGVSSTEYGTADGYTGLGKILANHFAEIPTRQELVEKINDLHFKPFQQEKKRDRELRILNVFDVDL